MLKIKALTAAAALAILAISPQAFAKKTEITPAGALFDNVARVAGLSQGEKNRAFRVLLQYETGQLTLPELDRMSDDYVLALVDKDSEAYVALSHNESALIRWKRMEIRAEMLAEIANVELEKFWPFFRVFPKTLHDAYSLIESQARLEAKAESGGYSAYGFFDDDEDPIIVECELSCDYIDREEDHNRWERLANDMARWEMENGSVPVGTEATIVNPETGGQADMKKSMLGGGWSSVGNSGGGGGGGTIIE